MDKSFNFFKSLKSEKFINGFLIIFFFSLMFILNIPHTTGVRNILFYFLLLLVFYLMWKNREQLKVFWVNSKISYVSNILLIITLYIILHSLFLSYDTLFSLDEFRSQWFVAMLYLIVGFGIAVYSIYSKKLSKELLITIIFYSIFIHILYIDLFALSKYLDRGVFISRFGGLMNSPTGANYLTNILLAVIASEIIYRLKNGKRMILVSNLVLYVSLILTILSSLIEGIRHGSMAIIMLGITASILFMYNNKNLNFLTKLLFSIGLSIVFFIPISYNIYKDKRWETLLETIPIAMDTKNNLHWLNQKKFKAPKLSNGKRVAGSNYLRVAFASRSIEYIKERPLGIGYGRRTFGRANALNYDQAIIGKRHDTHSGLLSWTLGLGVIGLSLLLIFVYKAISLSIKSFKVGSNYFSMLTMFLVSGFFLRSIVDTNIWDDVFLRFIILFGISLTLMIKENESAELEKN